MLELRSRIEEVTTRILKLAAARVKLASELGRVKRELGLSVYDPRRELELAKAAVKVADEARVPREFALEVLAVLLSQGRRAQGFTLEEAESPFYSLVRQASTVNNAIRLDIGETCFTPPREALEAAVKSIERGEFRYTPAAGLPDVRARVAELLSERLGVDLKAENVALTPGAKMGVYASMAALAGLGSRVLVFKPSWPAFTEIAARLKAITIEVERRIEEDWSITEVPEADFTIVCSPDNPTGRALSRDELEHIAEKAEEHNAVLLSDETYGWLSFREHSSVLQAGCSKAVYVTSLSKAFGMTGFRAGVVVSSPSMVEKIAKVQSLAVTCVPPFIQRAAAAALETKADEQNKRKLRRLLEVAEAELASAPLRYYRPDGGLYLFPEVMVEEFTGTEFSRRLLHEGKVAVAPGSGFGAEYSRYLRITYSVGEETLKAGLAKLRDALDQYSWSRSNGKQASKVL
ncbi:MAG: hypothetical protein DRN99_06140 [Thermoproteota archaeon]|nr:MAG: hypothetical protein DRN99_06140 [Candidatus Korarchaeota archaeon]